MDEEWRWWDAALEDERNESETMVGGAAMSKSKEKKKWLSQKDPGAAPSSVWAHFIIACRD